MPTDNKKISAYVPDAVYDRFKQFQEEHKLSMSQAAIEIFAAYFGINLNPTISSESTSELLGRVDTLEKELADLKQSYVSLFKKVDLMQFTSELLVTEPLEVSVDKSIDSKLDSSLQSELPKENIIEQPIDVNIIDESKSSLDSELLLEVSINNTDELVDNNSELLSGLPSEIETNYSGKIPFPDSSSLPVEPLKSEVLAKRIGVAPQTLVNQKSKFKTNDIEFFNWLYSKDPDGIRWIAVPQKKGVKYIPDNKTSSEKLQSLKNWVDSQN